MPITAVRFTQSTKTDCKTFLEGVRLFNYFHGLHKQTNSYAMDSPDLSIRQDSDSWSESSSANLKRSLCFFLFCSCLGRRPLERHISPLMFIKESFVGKNMSSCDKRKRIRPWKLYSHGSDLNFSWIRFEFGASDTFCWLINSFPRHCNFVFLKKNRSVLIPRALGSTKLSCNCSK